MGNSIRTTSKNNTSTLTTNQATFDIGDVVLCPSLTGLPFTLTADPYGKRDLLTLTHDGSYFYYDDKGYFVSARDTETGDYQPSLFHDTPANRQAIATLYSGGQISQRKVINITKTDDKEAVLIPAFDLSNIACDIGGTIAVLNDIGSLLWMIYQEKITPKQAISMARLSHDATERWEELLGSRLKTINESLAQTVFGTEVSA